MEPRNKILTALKTPPIRKNIAHKEEEMASTIKEGIVEATVTTEEVKILDGQTLSLIMKKTETVMRTREEGGIGKLFIRGTKEAILKAKIEVTKLLK